MKLVIEFRPIIRYSNNSFRYVLLRLLDGIFYITVDVFDVI